MSKNNQYNYAVYIGRFQPFHLGHLNTIKSALEISKKLIVVLGSANSPRTIKSPFTVNERIEMIQACLTGEECDKITFTSVEDQLYNNANWAASVLKTVGEITNGDTSITLLGAKKDQKTESYINFFKQWDYTETAILNSAGGKNIDATKVRELYFCGHLQFVKSAVPDGVYNFLEKFQTKAEFHPLCAQYDDAVNYDKKFASFPKEYSLNFVTVDAIVVQSGHILLIKRKKNPGKDLWAVVGGHVNPDETLEDAMIRELREETGIKVPEKVLRGSIVDRKIFDHPDRSLRGRVFIKNGRTITSSYCIKLDDNNDLPRVSGLDDAADAHWFTFSEVRNMRNKLFEDHYDQILYFLNRL
jgi:bifunctional NMN adenylyltransferase/nudix hydrolase